MVATRKIYQPLDLKNNALTDFAISFTDNGSAAVGVITDSRSTATGIEYAADYSASYTARSLTDKAYVDGILAANDAMTLKGVLDASGVNQLPAGDAGDTYKISVAGDFNGTTDALQIGDTVYCLTDSTSANTPANWVFVQSNLEAASETVAGFIELATQAEVDTGTDTTRAVTAATLEGKKATGAEITAGTANSYVAASSVIDEDSFASDLNTKVPTQQSVKAYVDAQVSSVGAFTSNSLAIGPTANAGSPVTVNHALATLNVIVQVYDGTTEELIDVAVDRTDANNITLDASEDITVDVTILSA